jgi:hypothetical protein
MKRIEVLRCFVWVNGSPMVATLGVSLKMMWLLAQDRIHPQYHLVYNIFTLSYIAKTSLEGNNFFTIYIDWSRLSVITIYPHKTTKILFIYIPGINLTLNLISFPSPTSGRGGTYAPRLVLCTSRGPLNEGHESGFHQDCIICKIILWNSHNIFGEECVKRFCIKLRLPSR